MFNSKKGVTEMSGSHFKRSLLAVSIMALSVPTFAQTNSTSNEMEEVVVTGMRNSLDTAQELKRNADTVKDVITASDIGALPDKSVTEALQRVPGVTIERFASSDDPKHYADEGTGVLVRGLDRVRSEINGRDAFSANPWGGLSYEDFPAELLGAVEVVKNQTADLISGGIAGTVNLITRKPFDSDERLLSFNAKANYGDFREEVTPSFSALFADSWETSAGKFGFLVAGSQSEYKSRGDGVGLGNFQSRGVDNTVVYDEWGTPGVGITPGSFSHPCVPGDPGWRNCDNLGFPDAVKYTAADAPYEGSALTGQEEGVTWYTPSQYHMSTAENDRERTGFTTSLQWANNDETVVATLEHINSKASLEYDERRVGHAAQGFKGFMGSSHDWLDQADAGRPRTFDANGHLTSGVGVSSNAEVPLFYITRWNYNENTVEDTSFNLALTPSDRLKISLDYQHIDSEKLVHNYSMSGQTRGGANASGTLLPFFLDLRGDLPTIEYLNTTDFTGWINESALEPEVFIGSGMQQEELNNAKSDSFKIDVEYALDGIFTAVKGGVYFTDKSLTVRDTEYAGWSPISTAWVNDQRSASAAVNHPELYERIDFSDFYNGEVLRGDIQSFLFPSVDLVKNYAQSLRDGCAAGWSTVGDSAGNAADKSGGCAIPYEDMEERNGTHFAPYDISESGEKRTEFYLRGDFEFADLAVPIKGNVGLRYVNYKLESTGYTVLPPAGSRGSAQTAAFLLAQYPSVYNLAGGESQLSTVEGTDYDTVLPSLNLTFGITDDLIVRFGASQGLYYPSLLDTRNRVILGMDVDPLLQDESLPQDETSNPVIGIESVSLTAQASNPFLEPEESVNFDLTTEWYFAQAGSVSVGVFHKELDNIIRNRQFDLSFTHDGAENVVSAYGPANTGSGTIRGVEFSYSQFYDMLPGAWSGLGLQFNYTFIDQSGLEDPNGAIAPGTRFNAAGEQIIDERNTFRVFSGLPLQGYSDENLNIVGMYEYNDISFRLAYTWRSEYLLTLRESEDFAPVYAKATGMMDASLYYAINDTWKVGIEGSNLLNNDTKTQYQMNQEGLRTDALSFTTDRRYALSVRATF
ncbi:TonB-dependent receptor [Cellvibrio sp. PSBB023]|uniref:TonB-dependent receptor n=1 Tax=Cellvibrio sp. PSBB023 TaxID=1945512 RepID=UPI00098EEB96|nr:TonB-dependent receptor [Cellvibrio sp. PSBB023]AQT61583.1 TonB-dependent receptor [Cellvibrio sp. PSBB023]